MLKKYCYIDIHSHQDNNDEDTFVLTNIFPEELNNHLFSNQKYISCGLHPWHIDGNGEAKLQLLINSTQKEKLFAIGETGLDRRIKTPLKLQEKIFEEQIKLAEELQKPLIIHCVKAYADILHIKKKSKSSVVWIIHGFQGSLQLAEDMIKHGCYLSFGKSLLENKPKICQVFREVLNDRFFLETDEAEVEIRDIYLAAAKLKEISITKIIEIINENFKRCFNYGKNKF